MPPNAFSVSSLLLVALILGVGVLVGYLVTRTRPSASSPSPSPPTSLSPSTSPSHGPSTADPHLSASSSLHHLLQNTLSQQTQSLLALMEERYQKHKEHSHYQVSSHHHQLSSLVEPIKEQLQNMNRQMDQLESSRESAYNSLKEACDSMHKQFTEVFSKSSRKGCWGEIQLRKILEMAGLIPHVDFDLQPHFDSSHHHRQSRPDALIKLPHQKCIIIDAKTPMDHFLRALETESHDTSAFQKATRQHVKALQTHIKQLAQRPYLKDLSHYHRDYVSAEFVVMFVPVEGLYALALEHHIDLFDEASRQGIILSTPSSLLGLMKTIAFIWQEHTLSRHSRDILRISNSIIDALSPLQGRLADLGKSLEKTLTHYNHTVSDFNTQLIPHSRKLQDLGLSAEKTPNTLPNIERRTQSLQPPPSTSAIKQSS